MIRATNNRSARHDRSIGMTAALFFILGTPSLTSLAQDPAAPRDFFAGAVDWLNTAKPIASTDLKGKVVLLDFWTYCCINCHHIIPDLEKLEKKYANELVVIGVHTPKFDAERDSENIRQKVREYEIKHPIANDANQAVWNRFGVRSWPTLAVIDANGQYRGSVAGEGNYEVLDEFIGKLIADHKAKGELDETPFVVYAESDRPSDGPLLYPGKVFADAAGGRLFISDTGHNRIAVTSLAGEKRFVIGSGEQGLKDGDFATARFNRPQGLCLVGEVLYVADTENHAIRRVDLAAKSVTTVAGNGTQGYDRKGQWPAKEAVLNSPWDVLPLPGTTKIVIAMAGPHQLWTYDTAAQLVAVWAGSGREDIIDGAFDKAAFAQPSGLATDGELLFVADSEVSGIRAVSIDGKAKPRVDTVAGLGLFEFGDVDGRAEQVRLQHCLGLAFAEGVLYIADTYNNKIKVCDPKSRSVKSIAGTKEPGASDGAPSFYQPGGLSVAGGELFVADTNNHLVRVIDLKANTTRTLELKGLESPAPPARKPTFRDPIEIVLEPIEVAPSGDLTIEMTISMPGFKVAPETPTLYLVEAEPSEALGANVSSTGTRVVPQGDHLTIPITLSKTPAPDTGLTLRLSASIFACSTTNGFCTLKNYVWSVPLRFKAGAPASISLSTLPE